MRGTPAGASVITAGYSGMNVMSPIEQVQGTGSLPAFVEKAREDALWRAALEREGYNQVKAAYTQQIRDDPAAEYFRGLQGTNLPPPMPLVHEWLKAKGKGSLRQLRRTFFGTMIATIAAGLACAAVYSLLS